MKEYQNDMVDVVRKAMKGNKVVARDTERLTKVKRKILNGVDAVCVNEQ